MFGRRKPALDADGLVPTLTAAGPTTLTLTVHNPTDAERTFCTYHTPFEGIANDIFIVTDASGAELDYRGKLRKRAPPGASDYKSLKPNASVTSREVDLASCYDLAGPVQVRYRGTGISGLPDSEPITLGGP